MSDPDRSARHTHHTGNSHPVLEASPALALDPEMPRPSHEPEIATERLDQDALKVISRLHHMRHQAYLVGGCVRDLLLGRKPKDFDVATDAHPGEVRAVFRNCRLIGRRFRLAHVYFRGGKFIEVATFRKNPIGLAEDQEDGDLLITRDNVFGTAEEDARRRDFTVNGLFYDLFAGEVIDYVGGRRDLEEHRIATIGDPEIRIREDPVRTLRAVRFAARLGFVIEPETFAAMRRHAAEIARCAQPRLLEEIFKILRCGTSVRAFELLRTAGALGMVLPTLSAAVERAGEGERRRFFAYLAALDELVRSGAEVSEAVLLGALLMHLTADASGAHAADALLQGLVQTARLPRRMAERARIALHAQCSLHGPSRRRRRGGGIAGQAYFRDALQLLELKVRATGEGTEELERWKSHSSPHHQPSDHVELPGSARSSASKEGEGDAVVARLAGESDQHGRRRRRGGRRRRRRGNTPAKGAAPIPGS
jgi:poly(A) polymerase